MQSRLEEIRGPASVTDVDVEEGRRNSNFAQPQFLQDFFQKVEVVKGEIVAIRQAAQSIGQLNQEALLATTQEKEQQLSNALQPIVDEANVRAKNAKALLQEMRNETDSMQGSAGGKQSELRIRENLTNTLTRKFVDVMRDYQQAQQKYKTDIKKKVQRQVQIVKPEATAEEIDTVMRAGGGAGEIYRTAILRGAADPIKAAYAKVVDKYQDVLVLEASVQELHQMFQDFAVLTERQGELLDQIEYQVKSAADFIDGGNTDIVQAIEYQKSIRKKQCWIIMIVLVIIGIIIAIVFATQG